MASPLDSITKVQTYKPEDMLELPALTQAIPAFRFVSHMGSLCGAGLLAAGVSNVPWDITDIGQPFTVVDDVTGIVTLSSDSDTVVAGDKIMSAANGYGKKHTDGNYVNGIALFGGTSLVNIEIDLESFYK